MASDDKADKEIDADSIWQQCLELIQKEEKIPEGFVKGCLEQGEVEIVESQLVFQTTSGADRARQEYGKVLTEYLAKTCESMGIEALGLQVFEAVLSPPIPFEDPPFKDHPPSNNHPMVGRSPIEVLSQNDNLKSTFTFENFVPGNSSRLPLEACKAVAESPGDTYNPLFLYGEVGLGKTHLLHAVAHYVIRHNAKYIVRYTTTENFVNQFVASIQDRKGLDNFKKAYRNADLLLLDDIQFLAGKEATTDEMFNTLNELDMNGKQVVLAADRQPAELEDIPDRLISRFKSGLVLDVKPPDLETRIAILQLKVRNMRNNVELSDDVYQFIAENFVQNIRELEGALTRVLASAKINSQSYISLQYVKDALNDLVGTDAGGSLSPPHILEVCAEYLYCSLEELVGPKRTKQIITCRHISMHVMREITELSYPQIGEVFGGRDHSTIMHADKKIKEGMLEDPKLLNQVTELFRILKTKDAKFLRSSHAA